MSPFALLLIPLSCIIYLGLNEVDPHNKPRQYDLVLENLWVTQCGWLRLCTTVSMRMTITNFWKLFPYEVKIDNHEKSIGIIELLEQLTLDCFNNHFSTDIVTLANNITPLDEVDVGETVYTCRELHSSSYASPST